LAAVAGFVVLRAAVELRAVDGRRAGVLETADRAALTGLSARIATGISSRSPS